MDTVDMPIVTRTRRERSSRLWLWVVAAFAVQIAAWVAWFIVAAHHPIEEVPLAAARSPGGRD